MNPASTITRALAGLTFAAAAGIAAAGPAVPASPPGTAASQGSGSSQDLTSLQGTPSAAANELNACAKDIGGQPRTALKACLQNRIDVARKAMRQAYATTAAQLKQIDSAATPDAMQALEASQESFDSFMLNECRRQGAALLGGSGAGDVEQACQAALMRWRAAALRQN
ncbi:hypothetical protein CAL14_12605 [Bordetella genomosp. 9]|nr:hypothetical protein CAL14_12605 [Bordetella genomosp. 9]